MTPPTTRENFVRCAVSQMRKTRGVLRGECEWIKIALETYEAHGTCSCGPFFRPDVLEAMQRCHRIRPSAESDIPHDEFLFMSVALQEARRERGLFNIKFVRF